ncbi:hypothetical protein Pst134EA_011933 [Puccinia striiformis f. sp. tritici]|uniref:Secreted protein n=2 Tax=Puccinia striiformis TaxID=27350 RepID=A0A0L0VLJ3_9BASI|nr:hypothetical protein Pst134EA_011933 [Puccinia striiformis f. sp. tritici]KAI9619502.1 hypothetical protein H4Q26_014266 [Puccinia striiformis f. sp. tritici PST-130]KNF00077.1 hypothetical protein PSTG_06698 [Puccinia striiformis f. sp. tritici PST-78]POW03910.1 hypothetical protein PSTT_10776 [Puccinia striiformis]KAH9456682.1 hypothetical protein Pst134EB_012886 [Puccinia striiformis f. sp. tritici]KAH9468309.1 hypothetical protein Pst134EA_011933 [Puccinia striiformis f. sp. tritici]
MHLSDLSNVLLVVYIHLIVACAVEGETIFACPWYGYCANKSSTANSVTYAFGPATTKPTSAEYSCDGSKLSGKPIINVCCLNYAGSLGMRKPNDPLKVSGDDFKNKFGCVEAPNTD